MADRMQTLRVRAIALVDGLPDWDGFDRWLAAEHTLGAALGREAMDRARRATTLDEHVNALKPFIDWGMALGQNLRHFRKVGYNRPDVEELSRHASEVFRGVYARNGWGEPQSDGGVAQPG